MKKKTIKKQWIAFSVVTTLAALAGNQFFGNPVHMDVFVSKLGFPLARLIFFIFIGLAAGIVIETLGWTRQVAVLARPFFNFSNLGDRCSAAFTAAFISGVTANAMLLEYYQENRISKMQLFLSNYVNQFPAFFLHLPTTLFIILPLTGRAGALYLFLTFAATLFRTICFLIFGRLVIQNNSTAVESKQAASGRTKAGKGAAQVIEKIKTRLPSRLTNIVLWVLPIYTIVFLLNHLGFFQYLNRALSQSLTTAFIPVESLSVIILSFAAEFTSGFAAAGALLNAGVLTVKQTVIALLLGNILAFPIRALRHQLPRYMGIFSPKMGLQLLLSGQAFRIASLILVGTLYYMVA